MDSLDIRIYREFFHPRTGLPLEPDIRRSYRNVARKLRIDEVTVRNRIKRLQLSGFLKGWRVIVNPNLLGVHLAQLWLNVQPLTRKDALIEKLKLMHGVLAMSDCYGSTLSVILMYEGEISARKEFDLIQRIANAERLVRANIPFPDSTIELTHTDWRIIEAVRADPRQSYPRIAREVGVSSKTVRRRLQRMMEERALFVIPSLNPGALDGAIIADLVVFYANPESKSVIDKGIVSRYDELLIRAELGDREHGFFNLIITNISQAKEISTWVKNFSNPAGEMISMSLAGLSVGFQKLWGMPRGFRT